jgi:hypothetical protein
MAAVDNAKSLNQQLVEAAAAGDIDLRSLALSKGADDCTSMLIEFMKAKNVAGAKFALGLFEKKVSSPDVAIGRELVLLFKLVGLVGDKEMRYRAITLFDKMTEIAWFHTFQRFPYEGIWSVMEKGFILPMLEGAAESGRLDVYRSIEKRVRAGCCSSRSDSAAEMHLRAMLEGGSRGDSVAVCKRAIELGADVDSSHVVNAALHGSFDVFCFILKDYLSSTERIPPCDIVKIEEGVYKGRDSVKKFDFFMSELLPIGRNIGWKAPSPSDILHRASDHGNAGLCRYAKEKGATDLKLVYSGLSVPIDQEVLELGIEWGVDINECNCYFPLTHLEEEYDKSHDPLQVKRENRRRDLEAISKRYNFLHEHGYRNYSDMLIQAATARSRTLVETVIEWGKNDLREGDEGFKSFTRLCKSLRENNGEVMADFSDDMYAEPAL